MPKPPYQLPPHHEEAALSRLRKQFAVNNEAKLQNSVFDGENDSDDGEKTQFRHSLMGKFGKKGPKPTQSLSPEKEIKRKSVNSKGKTPQKQSEKQGKVSTVTVGDDLLTDTGRVDLGSSLERRYQAWAAYQLQHFPGKKAGNDKTAYQATGRQPGITPELPERGEGGRGEGREVNTLAMQRFLRPVEGGSASPAREVVVKTKVVNLAVQLREKLVEAGYQPFCLVVHSSEGIEGVTER